jgi:hypothetical protein|tara:strand:- start:68 stop:199 length:132 start_codon:yes stop_codon:yes gene_type:complete
MVIILNEKIIAEAKKATNNAYKTSPFTKNPFLEPGFFIALWMR